jgi:tRNA (cmo5U34)-methyltransferase
MMPMSHEFKNKDGSWKDESFDIPKSWTFKNAAVAEGFDAHVREQLPWYDLCTRAVVHFGRHYIPTGGVCYDIGASTGNIGRALADVLEQRKAKLISIEESAEMAAKWSAPGELVTGDALTYNFDSFDFATLFLVLMFLPIHQRAAFLHKLYARLRSGGALVVVDKLDSQAGYAGTALRRLALAWKLESGTTPQKVLEKELSLAGYQRPINPEILPGKPVQFFLLGEFAGWIIAKE